MRNQNIVKLDSKGRILIPKFLKEYARIDQRIIIVGVSKRIEVWADQIWQEFYSKYKSKYEDIAERIIK